MCTTEPRTWWVSQPSCSSLATIVCLTYMYKMRPQTGVKGLHGRPGIKLSSSIGNIKFCSTADATSEGLPRLMITSS